MGDAMKSRHGSPYNVTTGTFLYTIGGTMTDWVATQIILSYTIDSYPCGNFSETSGFKSRILKG